MVCCVRCKKPAQFASKAHCASKTCTWFDCENCGATYGRDGNTGFKFEGKQVWHSAYRQSAK